MAFLFFSAWAFACLGPWFEDHGSSFCWRGGLSKLGAIGGPFLVSLIRQQGSIRGTLRQFTQPLCRQSGPKDSGLNG